MTDEIRKDLKYTESHEWLKIKGKTAIVGITDHAQSGLNDIIYGDLPPELEIGSVVNKGDLLFELEAVKTSVEVNAPISGKIIRINDKLIDDAKIINESPYDDGWLVELEIKDKSEIDMLIDAESYKKLL
ncbi:MAG: glycine cleavage system protein GcvH [Thermoplasmatales archaeon]|nr:glycine cleavage system protein GcvH [Thermoplasmatales archaeon]